MLKASSLIFAVPHGPVDLRDYSQGWQFKFGANWRRPYRPRSSITASTTIRWCTSPIATAEAYATWAGKALPTKAE